MKKKDPIMCVYASFTCRFPDYTTGYRQEEPQHDGRAVSLRGQQQIETPRSHAWIMKRDTVSAKLNLVTLQH